PLRPPLFPYAPLFRSVAGVIAAVRRGKASDYAATTVALVGLSVPHFWLGLLMIVAFAVKLQWLPAGGYVAFGHDPIENLRHMLIDRKSTRLNSSHQII